MSTDISAIINSFFVRYSQEFRQGKLEAFEVIMALAMSHAYGCCNPKQWADYLGIQPQKIYAEIQKWSLYRLKELLIKMMVHQAASEIKEVKLARSFSWCTFAIVGEPNQGRTKRDDHNHCTCNFVFYGAFDHSSRSPENHKLDKITRNLT